MIWHSYYSQGQIPHATADKCSFWWNDLLHLCDKFRGVAVCKVGCGTTVLFWLDFWNGHWLQEKLPRLFSFARNQKSQSLIWRNTSTFLSQTRHSKNSSNLLKSCKALKWVVKKKTNGIIFGPPINTLQGFFTIIFT
jgi:hypothetical protein